MTIGASELAERVRRNANVRLDTDTAAMFLGYWLEQRVVEEPLPGRYRLTDRGKALSAALLLGIDIEQFEDVAA